MKFVRRRPHLHNLVCSQIPPRHILSIHREQHAASALFMHEWPSLPFIGSAVCRHVGETSLTLDQSKFSSQSGHHGSDHARSGRS